MDSQRFDDLTRRMVLPVNRKQFVALIGGLFAAKSLATTAATSSAKRRGKKQRPGASGSVSAGGGQTGGTTCAEVCTGQQPSPQCLSPSICSSSENCPPDFPVCCMVGSCGSPGEGTCCALTCGGACLKDSDCPALAGCVCELPARRVAGQGALVGQCGTVTCPGSCTTNQNCTAHGQDSCVCFLGVNTADAALVDAVVAQGTGGNCGDCRGSGEACEASTECCGQLVCDPPAAAAEGILTGQGTCRHKPKPSKRCKKHGQGCQRDGECCAQGSCYKGKCGENDTHCKNDGQCARGYRCQGGPLAPGHRRCRKNGARRRNRTR
jgi:hypothetical protein